MIVSKTVSRIVLILLCFQIIGKTIKTSGFYNNTQLLNQSSLNVSFRGISRTLSNIYDGELVKIVKDFWLLTIFAKCSILDIWEGCECAYVIYDINTVFAY